MTLQRTVVLALLGTASCCLAGRALAQDAAASMSAPRPRLPVRAERRLALTGELGWNGLAGFGPVLGFHADPHLSFELGLGLSLVGRKVGLRTRYNLLESPLTPFIGVGIIGASGFGDSSFGLTDESTNDTVTIRLRPSAFVQGVAGLDWTSRGGFTLIGALGYARLLEHDNVEVVTGTPTRDQQRAFDITFRSSAVVTLALGYSFR